MNRHELQDLGGGTFGGLLASRAASAPDNLALVFDEREWSYAQVDRQATAVGAGFLALGLAPGATVCHFLTNRPEYVFSSYGCMRAGLVSSSANTAFKGPFLRFNIAHPDSEVLITEKRLGEALLTLGELPACVRAVVFIDGVPDRLPTGDAIVLSWEEFLQRGSASPEFPAVHPHDLCAIGFTSGTTGSSKCVESPHLQGVVMAKEAAIAFELTTRDRVYTCLPMFHGMAMVTAITAAFYVGAVAIVSARFSASRFWDELRAARATQFNALGSMLHMLLAQPPSPQDRDHAVTRVFSAPAPADVLYRFESRFGVHVIEGYGQTETKNVTYNPIKGRKVGSVGKPTATSILEVHDEHGNALPPGVVGEIVYRPRLANIMLRQYRKELEATLANMPDLWWRTGDLGSMDDDGFFYFHDRKKDALRRRGENISSQELEGALAGFPGLVEVAAVAARSELGEDEVMVVFEVFNAASFKHEALFRYCADNLPRFMVPRYYRVVETLPRTPNGKVRKIHLREQGITDDTWDATAAGFEVPR